MFTFNHNEYRSNYMTSPFALSLITVAVMVGVTHWLFRWWNLKYNGANLPPGSMGWPLLGESFHFFRPASTSVDIHPFVKQRMIRYGPIFKTSIVGRPMIVSADQELNHIIFQQVGQAFQSWYPGSFIEVFGREDMGNVDMHKTLKNMVLSLFGPESLKSMIYEIEDAVLKHLQMWHKMDLVEIKEATARMIFDVTARKLISHDAENSSENLRKYYVDFMEGLISFPLYIPGTAYYKCLQGKKSAMKMLKNMLHERRMNPRQQNVDFFDYVLEELAKEGTLLTEAMALDLLFLLLFASYETPSLGITLAIKYLTDNPLVLQSLTEEHENIMKNRGSSDSHFSWKDYKSMNFTFKFINETVRHGNIAPAIFRKVLTDVSFKDINDETNVSTCVKSTIVAKSHIIPEGWFVMVYTTAVHLNPAIYEDPLQFNPWRWEGVEIHGASKNFMAFGGGMRFCVGADFSKLQMAVFLHYLVTRYRWEPIKGGNVLRTPGFQFFPDGFHIRLSEKT